MNRLWQISIIIFVILISLYAQGNNNSYKLPNGLVGHWTFNNPNNLTEALVGNDLILYGNQTSVNGSIKNSSAVRIGLGSYYKAIHGISPNGGGKKVNQYTIVMDVKIPTLGKWHSLYQTDTTNKNDSECFITKDGVMGISATGYAPSIFIPNDWYRIAISVSNGKRHDYYIDGEKLFTGFPGKIDGRFALEPQVLFFADNTKEDYTIDVDDIKIFSRDLSDIEIKELGGYKHKTKLASTEFLPYLQSPTSTSIYVCWSFLGNNPSVEYGLTTGLGNKIIPEKISINGGNEIITWYSAKLKNLKPGTVYYYKVKTSDKESKIYKFKTQPADNDSKEHIRFAIYGDNRTDFLKFAQVTDALQSKVNSLYGNDIEESLNLVFNVGDIVTNGAVLSQYFTEYFNPISPISPSVPFMVSIGNHEGESPHYYKFMKYEDFAGSQGEKYYSFRIGRVLFIALNSNKQYRNNTQIHWLEQTLTNAQNDETIEWVFVFLHHPGHSELWTVGNTDYVQNQIIPTLIKYPKVDLLTYGHSHNYERGTAPNSNMRLMLSGGAGGELDRWEVTKNIKNYPEIQKSFDHYCYSIVDIDIANKRCEVVTYSLGNPNKKLDNVEIDRFIRDKKNGNPPETPSILLPKEKYVEFPFKLIASKYSGKYEMMSSQFQITTQENNFDSPVIDIIRDYEDIYGVTGPPNYTPINLNKQIDLTQYTVFNKNLYGKVWARVRYRDKNLQWSAWSEEIGFEIDDRDNNSP